MKKLKEKTLLAISASGLKKELKTSVDYHYGVFETATNSRTGEIEEWFLGFSRDYISAEKKCSNALDVNKVLKETKYTNIKREVLEVIGQ